MPKDKNKVVIVGIGIIGFAAAAIFAATRARAAPDDPGEGTIDIEILGPDGQPVPQV